MSSVCLRYKRVAWAQTGAREAIFTRLRCKEWSCDYCAAKNASEWREHLFKKLPSVSEEWYLITITANGETRGHIESFNSIRDNLDRLIKRVRRVFGKVEYVRVYEKHPKSEAIHAHIIMCGLTPFVATGYSEKLKPMAIGVLTRRARHGIWTVNTWFKKILPQCGMGFIAKVQKLDNVGKAVRYVAKYLTKALQHIVVKNLRHVQTTKAIGGPKHEDSEEIWQTGSYMTDRSTPWGTKITDLNTGKVIDQNFWEHTSFYPDDI